MSRLIDYDKAIDRYYAEYEKQDICDGDEDRDWLKRCFDDAPAIDPDDLRPRGRWVERFGIKGQVCCSECGTLEKVTDSNYKSRSCPNCGAKMIGDDDGTQRKG